MSQITSQDFGFPLINSQLKQRQIIDLKRQVVTKYTKILKIELIVICNKIQRNKQLNNKLLWPFHSSQEMLPPNKVKQSTQAKKNSKQISKEQQLPNDSVLEEDGQPESLQSQIQGIQNSASNNGLVLLAKKFVQLIKSSPNQTIKIQDASQRLKIQRRRIYDITNVLQGIGYIQKQGKNLKWVGAQEGDELYIQFPTIYAQNQYNQQEIDNLKSQIDSLKRQLRTLSNEDEYLNYFTTEDITVMMKSMEVNNLLLFIGDEEQLQVMQNLQQKKSQWKVKSENTQSKLFHCMLRDNDQVEITQNPCFDHKTSSKDSCQKVEKSSTPQINQSLFKAKMQNKESPLRRFNTQDSFMKRNLCQPNSRYPKEQKRYKQLSLFPQKL